MTQEALDREAGQDWVPGTLEAGTAALTEQRMGRHFGIAAGTPSGGGTGCRHG